jgi:cardiolipin synthase A/B
MAPALQSNSYEWMRCGDEVFPTMLAAIGSAQKSIRLETYIYAGDELGQQFRDALISACQRDVKVSVLLDAFGSQSLPSNFWGPLHTAGGQVRWFNPVLLHRFGFRDHRKMLVCDDTDAFVGGYNISVKYQGDGVKSGWRDLGLRVSGPLTLSLAAAFDEMFERADFRHKRFARLRRSSAKRSVAAHEAELLLSAPGRGGNPFLRMLRQDLDKARTVQIIAAYFLPTRRIRRDLTRAARRGARVQLILAGKSDVYLSQLAGRSLYRRLLRAGVEIYEYQPQILHAKLILIDDVVYAGSSNLDPRSLHINYELMLRFPDANLATSARDCIADYLAYSQRIELEAWYKSRSWWRRLKQRWAYFLLARADPFLARWQQKQSVE